MTRDPRIDPQPGDILRGVGSDGVARIAQVHYVTDERIGFIRVKSLDQREAGERCHITRQRFTAQAKDAEVLLSHA